MADLVRVIGLNRATWLVVHSRIFSKYYLVLSYAVHSGVAECAGTLTKK